MLSARRGALAFKATTDLSQLLNFHHLMQCHNSLLVKLIKYDYFSLPFLQGEKLCLHADSSNVHLRLKWVYRPTHFSNSVYKAEN